MAVLGFLVGGPAWLWHSGWISGAVQSVLQATFWHAGKAGLRVEEVLLQGREHESAERITQVLGIKQGAPILAINLQNARKRL
ncbi:MAG: FtsQ-type POTRA domain-containing protein, partial [Pseudomonadota bacterium]|nr:FtsQ-type POTRA domain-containing protein [Pseudomonadota bacterium]